jgi:hypothetical protein
MGPDYPSETFRVLKANEKKRFGEYRTQRLVLAAWDAQERDEIRDTSPPLTIGTRQTTAGSPPPALSDLATLPDGAWARESDGDDFVLAQLAALIRALPGPTPIADVRRAALYALEPRYLTRRSWHNPVTGQHGAALLGRRARSRREPTLQPSLQPSMPRGAMPSLSSAG